jgi:hypothetical protein
MGYSKRIYYTQEQKSLMWDRWQAGDSTYEIAKVFDRARGYLTGHRCRPLDPVDCEIITTGAIDS